MRWQWAKGVTSKTTATASVRRVGRKSPIAPRVTRSSSMQPQMENASEIIANRTLVLGMGAPATKRPDIATAKQVSLQIQLSPIASSVQRVTSATAKLETAPVRGTAVQTSIATATDTVWQTLAGGSPKEAVTVTQIGTRRKIAWYAPLGLYGARMETSVLPMVVLLMDSSSAKHRDHCVAHTMAPALATTAMAAPCVRHAMTDMLPVPMARACQIRAKATAQIRHQRTVARHTCRTLAFV